MQLLPLHQLDPEFHGLNLETAVHILPCWVNLKWKATTLTSQMTIFKT